MGAFHLTERFLTGSALRAVHALSHLSDRMIIFSLELQLLAFIQDCGSLTRTITLPAANKLT